ncbi:MAG: hypothetical protein L0332_31020, partial [Chloroflexi bacterium]|nr:hypothetical protein [Chloroflexota bacterium]MCI0731133.1 hypothetical protein [Chloroflexota bacterium]
HHLWWRSLVDPWALAPLAVAGLLTAPPRPTKRPPPATFARRPFAVLSVPRYPAVPDLWYTCKRPPTGLLIF